MSTARVYTFALQGIRAQTIDVQVQMSAGLPAFQIVGLADKEVSESRERIRGALYAMGLGLPAQRITVNLAPSDLQKEGSHYDLPIALGLLITMKMIPTHACDHILAMGELTLDGKLSRSRGALLGAFHASSLGMGLLCPASCQQEASWAGEHVSILGAPDLLSVIQHFRDEHPLPSPSPSELPEPVVSVDIKTVKGQAMAKRALEIAATGGHHTLMMGPPGAGKSMLASCLPGLLPPLTPQQALEVTMIHSLRELAPGANLITHPPYRAPHHSASMAALVGGGAQAQPGEVSLAHHGVLFLDEIPELNRNALEALRQPLETGQITISRAKNQVTYPARFQLIAAMNPCRCGYMDDPSQACRKAPLCGQDYQNRLSGPLWDRFDMQLSIPPLSLQDMLSTQEEGPSTETYRAKVIKAREQSLSRHHETRTPHALNASLTGDALTAHCPLTESAQRTLSKAADRWRLSARGYYRVIRLARTIADLDGRDQLHDLHIQEALMYRTQITAQQQKKAVNS